MLVYFHRCPVWNHLTCIIYINKATELPQFDICKYALSPFTGQYKITQRNWRLIFSGPALAVSIVQGAVRCRFALRCRLTWRCRLVLIYRLLLRCKQTLKCRLSLECRLILRCRLHWNVGIHRDAGCHWDVGLHWDTGYTEMQVCFEMQAVNEM